MSNLEMNKMSERQENELNARSMNPDDIKVGKNPYDHERSEQYRNYAWKHRGMESTMLTCNRGYWVDEMIPLFKKENPSWKSDVEVHNRLLELVKVSKRYN